ncbi:hypothetical protein T492DRAFT_1030482 [Pavlovales sp. CCMP2436]|nr:hypothetical protein T492DRAFT_1030482 [Pavlovales sp. CCMP2436]
MPLFSTHTHTPNHVNQFTPSPAAVSSARLAGNQPFSPLAPTTSASRCFPSKRTVQYSTKRRLLSAGTAGKHEGKRGSRAGTLVRSGRGEGHQGVARIVLAMASSRARPPCCSRYSATTRCAARLQLACRVVSETMPLAFGSAGASAHRHRCE